MIEPASLSVVSAGILKWSNQIQNQTHILPNMGPIAHHKPNKTVNQNIKA
jgi:hypothetical protein